MSEPQFTSEQRNANNHAGRGVKVVAGLALVVAIVCGAAAVLSFDKVRQIQGDLDQTRSSLQDVQSDVSNEKESRLTLGGQIVDLKASVQTVSDDLSDTSLLASNIDSFLQNNDLASASQVSDLTGALSDLAQHLDDVVSCTNDNIDVISRQRGQLQFCG